MLKTSFLSLLIVLIAVSACSQTSNFKLISSAFEEGKPIPVKYTCDGANVSPPLSWKGVPGKTKSFAIIMDDPDAPMGIWVHWVLYNISDTITHLEEKFDVSKMKAIDGVNSWGDREYNGPCPPGGTHRYVFKLYALNTCITAKEGMDKEQLLEAMKDHILAVATLTGLFRVE